MKRISFIILIVSVISLVTFSCKKYDDGEIPAVATFERSYDLNLTSNVDLLTPNGSIVDTTVGYRGIIVYRLKSDGTGDDFVAYEMACPYDALENGYVSWERWGVTTKCHVCGTQYLLMYGGNGCPIDGKQPSNIPLKQYETYFDGRYVIVRN